MRKKVIGIGLFILFVLLISIYIFIPSVIRISTTQPLAIPSQAATRCFNDVHKIKNWWPAKNPTAEKFAYNNYNFNFTKFNLANLQKVTIYSDNKGADSLYSLITLLLSERDSSVLHWACDIKTSLSPVKRIRQYLQSKEIKKAMIDILNSVSQYSSDVKNIYDIPIRREKIQDSVLIAEKKEFSFHPGITEIYNSLHSLTEYIALQNAKQVNYPICNISPSGKGFSLVVAVPINKSIKETAAQKIKSLLYNGNIVTAEITGGDYTINKTQEAIDNYIYDYGLMPAAISYQILITDREKETDTSKWTTKICYPIY